MPHTLHVRHQGYLQNARVCTACALVSGDRAGEQEKQMSTSELEQGWWGEGEQAGAQLPRSRQCAFLKKKKTLGPGGPGEWLFKTLSSLYSTTMEVNSVLRSQSQ